MALSGDTQIWVKGGQGAPGSPASRPGLTACLFAEGMALVGGPQRLDRGFAGWGYVLETRSRAKTVVEQARGGMQEASPEEAALFAVLKGLSAIRFPAQVRVFTASKTVLALLADLPAALADYEALRQFPGEQRGIADEHALRRLGLVAGIHKELRERTNIATLSLAPASPARPAPQPPQSLQLGVDAPTLRRQHCHRAHEQAHHGVEKAIANALYWLEHLDEHDNPEQHLRCCQRNFAKSSLARQAALDARREQLYRLPESLWRRALGDELPSSEAPRSAPAPADAGLTP